MQMLVAILSAPAALNVVSILYWRCATAVRAYAGTIAAVLFQFSIGDAQPRDADEAATMLEAVSILYWRCWVL